MSSSVHFSSVLASVASFALALSACGQTSQLNYHNDSASTGQNLAETQLNPTSVNQATFGKIYAAALDGQIYSQPLFVPGLTIAGGTHNVVYAATQHDSVYAIDSASGATLWTTSLLGTGEIPMPSDDTGTADLRPEIGVTSTPVITATADGSGARYIYLVAKSRRTISGLNHYYLRLHAINIVTGVAKTGSPVLIAETVNNGNGTYSYLSGPSVAGTGDGAVNGAVTMNAQRTHQRCALSLINEKLYFGSASHGTNGPYHGWVLGYDPATLARTAVFCVTPNGGEGGVWMGGNLITTDSTGALYFATGNGTFGLDNAGRDPIPADFDANGFPLSRNFGDSVVKLVPDASTASNPNPNGWGLAVADYFCPYNQRDLDGGDLDLGSGGVIILPDSLGSAAHPKLLAAGGKEGRIYLIDRTNLGKFRGGITSGAFVTSGDAAVQVTIPSTVHGILSTPALYNGQLYYAGGYTDRGKSFAIANGVLNGTPLAQTPDSYGYLGSTPTVSANGANNALVWCIDRGTNELRAYAASNFANELYTSSQAPNGRDRLGTAVKFGVPTVLNGNVYVGTSEDAGPSALVCYGLLASPTNPPAQPSNLYAQTVNGGEIDLFWTDNANNEYGYEVYVSTDPNNFPATPYATPGVDSYACAVTKLAFNTNYYFRVRSTNPAGNSAFSNAAGTTSGQAPPVDYSNGFSSGGAALYTNGFGATPAVNGAVLRLTDGMKSEVRSVWVKASSAAEESQPVTQFTTEFVFQVTGPDADGFTFALQRSGPTAIASSSGGGLGFNGISPSVGIKFDIFPSLSDTGYYLNGTFPDDNPAATANSSGSISTTGAGVNFRSSHAFRVILTYDGSAQTLQESITDLTTRAAFSRTYPLNLATVLPGSGPVYAGFTAATGSMTSTQDIQSWSYSSTLPTAPAQPTGLAVTAASGTQLDLSWIDQSNNETGFRIERKTGPGGTWAVIGSVGANTTVYHDPNLLTNTTYYYRVAATNGLLLTTSNEEVSLTTPVAPATPSNPRATFLSATRIDLAWTDNATNETGYRILRQANDNGFMTITTLPPNTVSYSDTGLSPDTTYDYHIQAYNEAGNVDFAGLTAVTPSSVNILASDVTAQVGSADTGTFLIRRTNALSAPLTVNYTINTGAGQAQYGVRYSLNPTPAGTVTIAAGATSAAVTVNPAASGGVLGTQMVTLTLAAGTGYSAVGTTSATVQLLDDAVNAWKVQTFGSVAAAQSAAAADTADYDGDGLPNLVEYALGLDPTKFNPAGAPRAAIENVDGGRYLTLTYTRPRPNPAHITYLPQTAAGLDVTAWSAAVAVAGYPLDNGNGTETCKMRAAAPMTPGQAGFMRLSIARY